jgi:hypothetical protein
MASSITIDNGWPRWARLLASRRAATDIGVGDTFLRYHGHRPRHPRLRATLNARFPFKAAAGAD